EKRVFLVILFTSFSGSLVSRIPGAVQINQHWAIHFAQQPFCQWLMSLKPVSSLKGSRMRACPHN
ncbi:hypothetical protein QU968_22975, partial [Escherichia coli]|nr:hypothetical protein [Escherichia coli]